MELFVHVVEQGSFTKAAAFCEIPKSSLSRRIRDLEQSLGTRLLERTTRHVSPTEVGEDFYHRAKQILLDVEITEKEIFQKQQNYSGKLTIFAPDCLSELCIDHINEFCAKYQDISLNLHSAPMSQQIAADKRFDLQLSIGAQPDSSFIARPLAKLNFDYFVSPDYLLKLGEIKSPQDLKQFDPLILTPDNPSQVFWQFSQFKLKINPKCIVDSPAILRSLAISGQGICCLPTALAAKDVQQNKLVRLFGGSEQYPLTVYGIYHSRRFVPRKVKLLLDEIECHMQTIINQLEAQLIDATF
jgi:DNA-binding transcriptional LysR family regulator